MKWTSLATNCITNTDKQGNETTIFVNQIAFVSSDKASKNACVVTMSSGSEFKFDIPRQEFMKAIGGNHH